MAFTVFALLIKEICIEKHNLYYKIIKDSPTKFLYLISCFLILLIIPFRLTCDHNTEDMLCVVALLLMCIHFMYYSRLEFVLKIFFHKNKTITSEDFVHLDLMF